VREANVACDPEFVFHNCLKQWEAGHHADERIIILHVEKWVNEPEFHLLFFGNLLFPVSRIGRAIPG
jgi:hypothetical protein